MAAGFLIQNNGILFRQRHGGVPITSDCCCVQDCPTDCADMGETRTVTLTGFTGSFAELNDVPITMSQSSGNCYWTGFFWRHDPPSGPPQFAVHLYCSEGYWYMETSTISWWDDETQQYCSALYISSGRINTGAEPPLGNWTLHWYGDEGEPQCDEDTINALLEKP